MFSEIIKEFLHSNKPIFTIGYGLAALCEVKVGDDWLFAGYNVTGPSLLEQVNT